MLKLLLGHWKAHRKKPSLLPEDGDVHFEDPSTINPLFEDSDSSLSSNKRATSPQTPTHTIPQVENEQIETGLPIVNELVDVVTPTHAKDLVSADVTVPKDDITDTEKDKTSSNAENILISQNLETDKLSKILESEVGDESCVPLKNTSPGKSTYDTSSKELDTKVLKGEENMRIYNQPSTSAIRENKKHSDSEKIPSPSKSTVVKNITEENNQTKSSINKAQNLNEDKNKFVSTPVKQRKAIDSPGQSKPRIEAEKPAKLRARAIDELIKKFQGQKTENDDEDKDKSKTEKKHSPNPSIKVKSMVDNVRKSEDKKPSSPSTEFNKDLFKIIEPKTKAIPESNKSEVQSNTATKKDQEIEALSNIFSFPPPPPLEPRQNESSLHGKILKDYKFTNPFIASAKAKKSEDDRNENDSGKTRSDSSLERTRTSSSNKLKDNKENLEIHDKKETVGKVKEPQFNESFLQTSTNHGNTMKDVSLHKNNEKAKETITPSSSAKETKPLFKVENDSVKTAITKTTEPVPEISHNIVSEKKESPGFKHKTETASKFLHKVSAGSSNIQKLAPKPPVQIHKSTISKESSKSFSKIENENIKSHSEDSGITKGDQISSETTQDIPLNNPQEESNSAPNSSRRSKKDKKLKSSNKKVCKNCRRAHNDSISITNRHIQCDDYYDGLTGARQNRKSRHSDSWTSDLSWEEKEFLRRLRSKRGTVRSNTPSMRSRYSKQHFIDENYFRRHHNPRHSFSDESSFYGVSLCSCHECWALHSKDYAYGRASTRGMSPIHEMCTCRSSRQDFLGRRVQFRSDTIHETSASDQTTTTTSAPIPEKKQQDEADDKSSQKSSKSKEDDSANTHKEVIKDKNLKTSEEFYRFVTPWELEEWDLLMKKHLLQKRRRRARCMGIMALAMVVFIGLVVAILMVYLRRKVI